MITRLLKYLIGIVIIILIFWNRFIKDRIEHALNDIIVSELRIIIVLILLIFNLYLNWKSIKKILCITKQSKILDFEYIYKIKKYLYEYVIESPKFLYNELTKEFTIFKHTILPLLHLTKYYYYPRSIAILFLQMPLIIVATMFIIDVIYLEKIHYFLLSLNLLIPLLIVRVFRYIIYEYTKNRFVDLEKYIEIHELASGKLEFNLKKEHMLPPLGDLYYIPYNVLQERLPNFSELWIIYRKINMYMTDIEAVRDYYNHYFMFYSSLCYIIGWSYFLLFILKFI